MLTWQELGWFALAALVLVLTPGPNMIYCVSRTLCQGRAAGMVSLAGVLLGFVAHLLAAALGLTALLMAVPLAFDSFFPQFLDPERGSVLVQSLQLGAVQITVSGGVNTLLVMGAGAISAFLSRSRGWLQAQRWVMGAVLGALALRIALMEKR